ncbi:exopolysaccharide biosynthesis protein [Histidinibacterium lentulum]|uniref:Exopolysaccharide biosynthesis protein n=1 Tax=Histidinibacterium lentulum TaxID=2480588 RepID=A0A3N2QVY9_9RHOB|nr:exopolysaccharide biosynthesis protein [Histidinibacterium lentulum]ROT99408.1 exopolysaccharide biosynthesis protein [Histidinibacterium lentulum]
MSDENEAPHPVQDVVDRLASIAVKDVLTLRELIEAFGTASFVPALMVPAILVVSPLSGIPVFSSICGLTIALVALQMLMARTHLWLPGMLMERRIRGAHLAAAMSRIRRLARWLDRNSRDRLTVLTRGPGVLLPRTLAMLSGLAMPFLELVPFSSSILGMATLFFAVSFLSRDGLFVVLGAGMMGLAALVPVTILTSIVE